MTMYDGIKAELLLKGKTMQDVFNALGISRQAFYMKCTGRTEMKLSDIQTISDVLDLTPEDRERIFFESES